VETVKISKSKTSITVALTSPPISIEVRAGRVGKSYPVEAWRVDASGLRKAGIFGRYNEPERAMSVALEVAQVLAIGLAVSAAKGEASAPSTLVPPSTFPRTCDIIEDAVAALKRVGKRFRKDSDVDADDKTTIKGAAAA
jgi:hypothetical protein